MATPKRSASRIKTVEPPVIITDTRSEVDRTSSRRRPTERPWDDRVRTDLSSRLVRIRPLDAVRFVFNDVVDRKTFRVRRTNTEPNTLSISYAEDAKGTTREEALATNSREHWVQSRTRSVSGYGQYAWQDSQTLLIGPPEGGWPQGVYVFFEFDKSLSDDAGNALKGGRDQVVIARVQSDARCVILRPESDDWFIPWRSGDAIFGREEDFSVFVVGQIIQHGATRFPTKVIVTAVSNRGARVSAEIMCGDHERRELRKGLGWSDWVPDQQFGGQWAIRLKLQEEGWSGEGAQAVVEHHHTWTISATVVMATGVTIRATNRKVVRFELYQPRLLMLFCPQIRKHHGIMYHWKYGKRIVTDFHFGRHDLGMKQFILVFDGEFDMSTGFSYINTYLSEEFRREVLYWERRWSKALRRWVTWVYLPGFHIHNRVRDILVNGRYRNRTTHTFTIKISTIAGSVIRISFPFNVDTLPLDLVNVAAIRAHFLRSGRFDIDSISAADGGFYISYGVSGRERIFVSYADLEVITGSSEGEVEIDWDDLGLDAAVATAWDDLIVSGEISEEIEISETVETEAEIDIEIEELLEEYGGGMITVGGEVLMVDAGTTVIDEDVILGGSWGAGGGGWWEDEKWAGTGGPYLSGPPSEGDVRYPPGMGEEPAEECDYVGERVRVVGKLVTSVRHEMDELKSWSIAITAVIDEDGVEWALLGENLGEIEEGQAVVVVGTVNEDCAIEVEEIQLLEEKPTMARRRRS